MIGLLQNALNAGVMHKCETIGCETPILRKDRFCESCMAEGFSDAIPLWNYEYPGFTSKGWYLGGEVICKLRKPSQAEVHDFLDEERER